MAIETLVNLIDMFRGEQRYNKELRDEALMAINRAAVATRTYEATVSKEEGMREEAMLEHDNRDREEEIRIGGLWHEAAIKTRDVSDDFAEILYSKSLYWMTNFSFGAEEVLAKRIDWDSIDKLTLQLLKK